MNGQRLLREMRSRGVSIAEMCDFLGISRTAFYRKRTGRSEFTLTEIQKIVAMLGLGSPVGVFFDPEVS